LPDGKKVLKGDNENKSITSAGGGNYHGSRESAPTTDRRVPKSGGGNQKSASKQINTWDGWTKKSETGKKRGNKIAVSQFLLLEKIGDKRRKGSRA